VDDKDFFDHLYQLWTKTTGAENRYYIVERGTTFYDDPDDVWHVWAVAQDESREHVAVFHDEPTADWFAGLHGCFADLTRRLHEAVDDAERHDCEKDRVISEMALLAEENNDLREKLRLYESATS